MISLLNIAAIIALFCLLSLAIIGVNYDFIFAQTKDSDKTNDTIELYNVPRNQAKVGDIDISYKTFGKGDPILLIMGYSGSKNDWDPTFLNRLSVHHRVIVFDNRGINDNLTGTKDYTINQLAEDTIGLLDALNISKLDVLGYSMGGMIAQELTLKHPEKVDDLIIYASHCGRSDRSFYPSDKLIRQFSDLNGTEDEIKNRFVPYQFPDEWKKQNRAHYDEIFASLHLPSLEILKKQIKAMKDWIKTGTCDRLDNISQDTLVLVGTEDQIIPSNNSLLLMQKIPGAWLGQFKEGGHALMFQYPEEFSRIILTFLQS